MTEAKARAARLLLPELDSLAAALANRIVDEDPAYAPITTGGGSGSLLQACRTNLDVAIHRLGELPVDGDAHAAADKTGRLRARQAVPLESVLHSYRLGGRIIWDALLRVFPPAQHKELLEVAGAVWSILDEQSVAMTLAYRDEEQHLLARDRAAQESALSALLDGAAGDPETAVGLARTLGIASGARLVLAVVDSRTTQRRVDEACRDLDAPVIWLPRRGVHVGLLQPGKRTATWLRDALAVRTRGRVALSSEFTHLADAAYAVRTAELAHAATAGEEQAVVLLEDRLVAALVAAAPDVAAHFVRRLARPLLDLGAEGGELIDTLEAVLACDGSHAQAAARLFVHRNTIAFRLRRLERLCGVGLRHNHDRVAWTLTLLAMGRPAALSGPRS